MSKNKLNKLMEEYKNKNSDNTEDIFHNLMKQEGYEWAKGVSKNQMIDAEVVGIDNKNDKVEIRTGLKSNSFIPFREFKNNEEQKIPEIGSTIAVIFEGIDSNGKVFVSYKKVKFEERLKEIEQMYHNKQIIEGTILYKQKVSSSNQYKNNSYVVDLGYGVIALVVPDGFTELEQGRKITAYVNRFDTKRFGIILGLKSAGDNTHTESENKYYDHHSQLKEGEVIELKVVEYKDFGILCSKVNNKNEELYFVTNTELTLNKRIRKKHEIIALYPLGKVFQAVVIAIKDHHGNKKLVISAREMFKDLMQRFVDSIKDQPNKKLEGTITEKRESELIVKIEYDGSILEGKLHRDDLSWSITQSINEFRSLAIGDKITVGVNWSELNMRAMDTEYGFLTFSVKILFEDPFKATIEKVKIGQVYPCTFLSYNDYGSLMSLKIDDVWTDNNVDILIQNKELKELSREINTKQGATNHAKVTKIDNQTRRIYISIKSAEQDNIDKYSASLEMEQNTQFSTLDSMKKKK